MVFGWLVGFLMYSSTTRLYRGQASRQSVCQFYMLPHTRQSGETMTSVSAGHIILTLTQQVGGERPQRGSNPEPPHQERIDIDVFVTRELYQTNKLSEGNSSETERMPEKIESLKSEKNLVLLHLWPQQHVSGLLSQCSCNMS